MIYIVILPALFAIIQWLLPVLFGGIPQWLKLVIFFSSVAGILIAGTAAKNKSRAGSDISVKMRDGNVVGRIGHSNGEREEER